MHEIIKESINDMDAALKLCKSSKNVVDVVDAVSELNTYDASKLGMNFKRFPLGCDLTEIIVGTCASDLNKIDLYGNSILADMIGAPIHICAYAFADIAESHGMKSIDIIREVNELIEVPLDLDHFGRYGPMRFPKEIVKCSGQCYSAGPPYNGCPRDRIHSRLIEKEKEDEVDKEEWVKLSSAVAINLTSEQGGEGHAAPLEEAEETSKLAKKYGKGVEAIMFVGDGYEDLITGFEKGIELGADVFVLEGGPFNTSKNRLESFAKAVSMARILVPGKVVATNGAYEDECRVGLRAGLNAIITGFPKNHHGYMCGYSPGTAKRGNFGLSRIIKIMKEEVKSQLTNVPIQKGELKALARAVKIVGIDNIYPNKIGSLEVGDAHWVALANSNLYKNIKIERNTRDVVDILEGSSVSLLGGRFVSWALAKELDGYVDEIIISDIDPWVEKATINNLQEELNSNVIGAGSNDKKAFENSNMAVITSTVPQIVNKISKNLDAAIRLI
ncbi:MAG: 5,10-methenyltetrahydromethanopterin hydrogenase cofactor biosynthesis protein HmdC [Methanobacterium sp. BRmetb2]|nr:MAG: 5,10-methenyltetrahydromethanopterin hydrogenase cofactor biosynthesis protein HmdC [Methanobacterium sp. BRmetb2]